MTGLFGGAFDPPHDGHVALAHAAVERFGFDPLVVLVVADPGHKRVELDAATRLQLAAAAFSEANVELDEHAFTVDTLSEGRWADPMFLIGADQFVDFPRWKEPERVLELARLGVATRPGYPREHLDAVLAELDRPERVTFFEIPPVDVSSRDLRRRIAAGEPLEGLVPAAVAALLEGRGLYRRVTG